MGVRPKPARGFALLQDDYRTTIGLLQRRGVRSRLGAQPPRAGAPQADKLCPGWSGLRDAHARFRRQISDSRRAVELVRTVLPEQGRVGWFVLSESMKAALMSRSLIEEEVDQINVPKFAVDGSVQRVDGE